MNEPFSNKLTLPRARVAWAMLLSLATVFPGLAANYAGWAVGYPAEGNGTILHTANSGATWERQGAGAIADTDMGGVCALSPTTAWVVGDAANGYATIYHTLDAGKTWVRMGSPLSLPNTNLYKVSASDDLHVWASGQGLIMHTSDGGLTWTNQVPAGFENTLFQGIATPDGVNIWAVGTCKDNQTMALKSTDAGRTWASQGAGFPFLVDHLLGVAALDGSTAWAVGGLGGYAFKTTDGGSTWTLMHQMSFMDANEVRVVSHDTAWLVHDAAIRWTHDGGITWSNFSSGGFAMGISVVDETNVWAVTQGDHGPTGLIYHTSDGGQNWEQQSVPGWTLPGLVNVSFAPQAIPEPPAPGFSLSIRWLDGTLLLAAQVVPGEAYALQATRDLTPPATWTTLATNTAAGDGALTFTNTPAAANGFYRIRRTP